jgi:hypothetical protein
MHNTGSADLGLIHTGNFLDFSVVFSTHYTLESISQQSLGEQVRDAHKLTVIYLAEVNSLFPSQPCDPSVPLELSA